MNLVFPCFCVVIAGAAGYIMEPELENTLLNKKSSNQPEVVMVTEDGQPVNSLPAPAPQKPEPKPETKFDVPHDIPAPPPRQDPQPAAGDVTAKNDAPPAGHEDLLPPPPASSDDLAGGDSGTSAQASGGIVDTMKQSIRDGQVTEFKYDQVLGWKETGLETFDGENYQTGLVAFKEDSIFGIKTVQAKALIKNGKVVKWIRVKTGVEVK